MSARKHIDSTKKALEQAAAWHRSGRMAEAEAGYRGVLEASPDNPDALHLLGLARHQAGAGDQALDLIRQAVGIAPGNPAYLTNLGEVLRSRGELEEAKSCFQRALAAKPDYPQAHNNLGIALQETGDVAAAAKAFAQAAAHDPTYAEAFCNLANSLLAQHRFVDSEQASRSAIALRPDYVEARSCLGAALHKQGRLEEALEHYTAALGLNGDLSGTHFNKAHALFALGRQAEAVESFRLCLTLDPGNALAHHDLGCVWLARDEPARARDCLEKALGINPRYADALNNLGTALQEQGKFDQAIAAYGRAVAIQPDHTAGHANLAALLRDMGSFSQARAAYRAALEGVTQNRDGLKIQLATTLPPFLESADQATALRRDMVEALDQLQEEGVRITDCHAEIGQTNFYLAYQGLNDRGVQERLSAFMRAASPALNFSAPHIRSAGESSGKASARKTPAKIKIGILSAFLHSHPVGRQNLRLVTDLDRDRFEVVVLGAGRKSDPTCQAIRAAADKVVDLPPRLDEARQKIAEQKLDLLFYLDIGMDPLTYFLSFARLAPVQCTSWGHPVTTGVSTVDYFISTADMEPPGAQDHYSERLVRLTNMPTCFPRPDIPATFASKADLGLPESGNIYTCPQTLFKFHPELDGALADILRRDRDAHLVLIEGKFPRWSEILLKRFKSVMPDVCDRILFLPHLKVPDFLSLLHHADVILDPFYFGGGVTSYEAFALGLPVVTWPGPFMRSRVTLACYRKMGVEGPVARDQKEYADMAVRLANDKEWRGRIGADIKDKSAVLFNNTATIHELENFFLAAVAAAHKGERLEGWEARP